jgi:sterol desaturase/sphingolipid hydroxylase (fatty acid hydroxylase superfamily)
LETILLALSTPLMVILIVFELLYSHFAKKDLYATGDTVVNLICTSWNFLNDLIFRVVTLFVLTWAGAFSIVHFAEKGIIYWVLLFLAEDIAYYVLHCADHYIRVFWATHVTHHSSEKFNLTVAIRSSVFQPYYRFIFYLPLAFLGFEALDIVFMYAACQVYGFWVHTETIGKLPAWFEYIFVTPSHHRVHHGSNTIYLDKNMGMALIIWDRLFGTFQEELNDEPVKFGLTTNVGSYHPLKVVFFEWKHIISDLRDAEKRKYAFKYLFGPPGWSHDGSRKTSSELRAELKNNLDNNPLSDVEYSVDV